MNAPWLARLSMTYDIEPESVRDACKIYLEPGADYAWHYESNTMLVCIVFLRFRAAMTRREVSKIIERFGARCITFSIVRDTACRSDQSISRDAGPFRSYYPG